MNVALALPPPNRSDQAEWAWLLKGFERITGCPTGRFRGELLASALRYRDEATGCLVDEGDTAGNVRRHTRRLWPQTEIAKAWIAQAESGEAGAADEARAALALSLTERVSDGRLVGTPARAPSSSRLRRSASLPSSQKPACGTALPKTWG